MSRLARPMPALAFALVTALVAAAAPLAARAQEKPLTIVIPFPAGGGSDAISRALGDRISPRLGRPVIVDPRPGASGLVASRHVLAQPADGATVYLASPTIMFILPRIATLEFDPMQAFVPVSNVGANPFVLGIHQSVPARDVRELIALAKSKPGQLNYASGGSGTSTHLVAALFMRAAGIDLVHIPYKGGAPAMQDLIAGHVQAYFGNPADFRGQGDFSRVRLIGVTGEARSAQLPDVPAIAEVLPRFRLVTWNGLVARAGTPQAAVDRIARAVQEAVKEPELVQAFQRINVDPLGTTPQAFTETLRSDRAAWDEAIRLVGLKPE